MKIGFAKTDITPVVGTELGGYALYRPCTGVHDALSCRAVVLEQEGVHYGLAALDLMCADEGLCRAVADRVAELGISRERLILAAIHSHAAPTGMIPGEGPLAGVNAPEEPKSEMFRSYMDTVVERIVLALEKAAENPEPFQIRRARGEVPSVGSERHTGAAPKGALTAIQIRTETGKNLILWDFPCHPTVLSAANTLVSREFVGCMEERLGADMAVFLNGAAGDISTRFTRRESSFAECERMGTLAAEAVRKLLEGASFEEPGKLKGKQEIITVPARERVTEEAALETMARTQADVKAAEERGADPGTLRILRSYVEGAGVNLQFARTMGDIEELHLPVTVFSFSGLSFFTVPGELFSTLAPEGLCPITYANGYYRYIADKEAYDKGYYEAMAAIVARGAGEYLMEQVLRMTEEIQ